MELSENIAIVQEKIACAAEKAGRKAKDVTLIAVSKTVLGDDFSAATSGRSTTSTPPALVILTISVGATFANDFPTSQANSALFDLITTSSN